MADFEKLQANLLTIAREVTKLSEEKFTGRIDAGIKMNQGGIDHLSFKTEKSLPTPK